MFHYDGAGRVHLNLLNKIAIQFEQLQGATLSPEQEQLRRLLWQEKRRLERRLHRWAFREQRHASWPYCGKRHRARIARQVAAGSLKEANGLVLA